MTDWAALTWQVNEATYAAWNAHDADAVAAVFAADARVRDASGDWEIGPDPVRARARMLMDALSDLGLERQTLLIDGCRHADRWVLSGTHDGEFFGIAPTGNAVRIEGATFTVIDEQAMVIEDIHQVDYATLFRQLAAT